jgi:glucose/arabinose dehydrogenase
MRFIFGGIALLLILIGGAVYFLYPTLYGIKPDNSDTPRLSDLISNRSSDNSGTESSMAKTDVPAETIIAEGLDTPWAIAFLPSGDMLVTERKGTVRLVDKTGKTSDVTTIASAKEIGEGGLLGIVLDPIIESNFVYLYYTYSSEGDNTMNRVVRMKYTDGKLTDEKILLDKIPGASNHNGGRIKFGPDNYLYITTGDAQEPSLAQEKMSDAGKILSVNPETGEGVEGNLENSQVYSYGHRNPQGIAWDRSGNLWETEHGPSGGSLGTGNDEVNFIESGKNYGWPEIQGDQIKSGMTAPVKFSTPSVSWAPGGTAIINNTLYFSGLRGQALYRAEIQGNKLGELQELFKGKYGRIREVIAGPDGMLYISTSNRDGRGVPGKNDDRIIRINLEKL